VAGLATNPWPTSITGVEYYIDTPWSTALTLWAGTTSRNYNGDIDISSLSVWTHTIYVRVQNEAGTRSTYTSQSFTKVAAWDTTAPTLALTSVTPTKTTVDILFTSNEAGTAKVAYGISASYGNTTQYTSMLASANTISLAWLTCATTYHYAIYWKDAAWNENNLWDATFTTADCDVIDTTAPTLTFNPTSLVSQYTQAAIAAATLTVTSDENWTLYVNGVSQWAITASNPTPITLWTSLWSHNYLIKVVDATGNSSLEYSFTYNVVADPTDTTAPTITYTAIANQFNVSAVPANIQFTLGDNVAVTTLTLNNWATTTDVFGSIVGWVYTLALSNSVWLHEYVLVAGDAAGNTTTKTITYNVVADSVSMININQYAISNLSNNSVTIAWTTDVVSSDSKVDLYTNGSSLLNQNATINTTNNTINLNSLIANKTYTVVVKSKAIWQTNYTTLSFTFKTAASDTGIVVNSVNRILNGNTPTPGWDYGSWYHFRFALTVNDMNKDVLKFKLANWSNSVTTMATANNTKIVLSADGVDTHNAWTLSTTLTAADTYSIGMDISALDADPSEWGKQIIIDMFYKIPAWSQWIFSTSYGIQAETTIE